jgi:hypothetical protein
MGKESKTGSSQDMNQMNGLTYTNQNTQAQSQQQVHNPYG